MVPRNDPRTVTPALVATGRRWTKGQRAAASVLVGDAPCRPVLLHAAIVGRARMPRAALDVLDPEGAIVGHVSLPNTSAAFDPSLRWWMVTAPHDPLEAAEGWPVGARVAFVSEGATRVLLPGSRLRAGAAPAQEWSGLACRALGWARTRPGAGAPGAWEAVLQDNAGWDDPVFLRAVDRFRWAAVTLPAIFFLVCFAYLFAIGPLARAGTAAILLLAVPVLGGGLTAALSFTTRRALVAQAERIEPGASRWGKEVAFTQSYWSGMRKAPDVWRRPLPAAAR